MTTVVLTNAALLRLLRVTQMNCLLDFCEDVRNL